MNKEKIDKFINWGAVLAGGLGLLVLLLAPFVFQLGRPLSLDLFPDAELIGQLGDLIGGVVGSLWALTGVFLFYSALRLQQKEYREQRLINSGTKDLVERQTETLFVQQFENTLFQLVGLMHSSMNSYRYSKVDKKPLSTGDRAFLKMQENLHDLFTKMDYLEPTDYSKGKGKRYKEIRPKDKNESKEWMVDSVIAVLNHADHSFRRIALQFYNIIILIGDNNNLTDSQKQKYIRLVKDSTSHIAFHMFLYYSMFRKHEPQKALSYMIKHDSINLHSMEGLLSFEFHRDIMREHLEDLGKAKM